MAMRRYPFDVFDEMERMMETMRRTMAGGMHDAREWGTGMLNANVSVETDDEGYVVLADVPGFEKEEFDLRFEDGVLIVDAVHEVERDAGVGSMSHSRTVHESVRLPGEISEDQITASYRNGVLEVRLPTVEDVDEDSHHIDVE